MKEPGQFDWIRRINCYKKSGGKCVDYLFGIKNGESIVQALRYKTKTWSKAAAKAHCKRKGGKFEAAGKEE